jgi:hypothetical protein
MKYKIPNASYVGIIRFMENGCQMPKASYVYRKLVASK